MKMHSAFTDGIVHQRASQTMRENREEIRQMHAKKVNNKKKQLCICNKWQGMRALERVWLLFKFHWCSHDVQQFVQMKTGDG